MATYYKWEKLSPTFYGSQTELTNGVIADTTTDPTATLGVWNVDISDVINTGKAIVETKYGQITSGQSLSGLNGTYAIFYGEKKETVTTYYHLLNDSSVGRYNTISNKSGEAKVVGKGSYSVYNYRKSYGYVYSTNPDAYPNGGISGDYYYSGRTTVTSPTAPSSISYPSTITTPSVTVSWTAASSSVPSYSVNLYELSYSTNGGSSWTVIGTTASTSYSFSIPAGTTSIQFRVRARDSNNQWGAYTTGTVSQVAQTPTLTVPEMVMQGQQATISWSAIEGADSYTLQRKSSADADWTQVYSGDSLSYTETVGTWTSLQYRVCALFGEISGGWAASGEIQIVAASALVISGTDGDLGTITSDISYSVATDTGNPISLTLTVNGAQVFSGSVGTPYASSIPVMDLPTGTGTIVITATVEADSGPVTVTRTWTYTKAAASFPTSGGVAALSQDGQSIFPQTLAEAVKTIGGPWGGNMSEALDKLAPLMISGARIATGSYTGTGTYGSSNPNTLTFPFEPKVVFIQGEWSSSVDDAVNKAIIICSNDFFETDYHVIGNSTGSQTTGGGVCNLTVDGNTISWYLKRAFQSTSNVYAQLNLSGITYTYVAFG